MVLSLSEKTSSKDMSPDGATSRASEQELSRSAKLMNIVIIEYIFFIFIVFIRSLH